jgi:branched-chain amino acid transport system ATP-binding protein
MLRVTNLEVDRGGQPVLHGITVEVRPSEIVAILGPNGAGKTTLMRTISGLLRQRAGRVTFGDTDLTGARPETIVRAGIIQVPEGRQVFPKLTVRENLELGCFTRPSAESSTSISEILERIPLLKEREGSLAGMLSGGEQQMLVIGRALVARPKLLLLDEPSLGLAPKVVAQVAKIIDEIRADGIAVLLVEQEVQVALNLSSRIYVLSAGQVVLSGPVDQLRERQQLMDAYLGLARSRA